jgi:DNA-binding beta-propeller fold protein YncE
MTLLPADAGQLPKAPKYPNIVAPRLQFGTRGSGPGQLLAPRGMALAPDQTMYVADCMNHRVQVFDPQGHQLREWGRTGPAAARLSCPSGVFLSGGTILVADAGDDAVKEYSTLGAYQRRIGSDAGPGRLDEPLDVWADSRRIYVSNGNAQSITVFGSDGSHQLTFGRPGSGPGAFREPSGVAADEGGSIYVADKYNHRIQIFDANGRFQRQFGTFGSFSGQLAAPTDIAINGGQLFVADSVNHRVQVFDSAGRLRYQFGRHPDDQHQGMGHLHYPMVITTDPAGTTVGVCEKFEGRCQVFDAKALVAHYRPVNEASWWYKYPYFHYRSGLSIVRLSLSHGMINVGVDPSLAPFGVRPTKVQLPLSTQDGSVEILVTAEEDLHRINLMEATPTGGRSLDSFGSYGAGPGQLIMPEGATMDRWGRIWVSDTLNNRIQVFDINGRLLKIIGEGSGRLRFREPGEGAVDPWGRVYIPDGGNGRIVVLDSNGRFLRSWGSPGRKPGQFSHPIEADVSPDGERVYTGELFNSRVQQFRPDGRLVRVFDTAGDPDDSSIADGELIKCLALSVGADGYVYATDDALDRVTKFTQDGRYVTHWGSHGSGKGELLNPQGVAVDAHNRVWVIDYGNHRGQTFSDNGKYLFTYGEGEIGEVEPAASRRDTMTIEAAIAAAAGALLVGGSIIGLRRRRWSRASGE